MLKIMLICMIAIAGCAFGNTQRFIGMSRIQVIDEMGIPEQILNVDESTQLFEYVKRRQAGGTSSVAYPLTGMVITTGGTRETGNILHIWLKDGTVVNAKTISY